MLHNLITDSLAPEVVNWLHKLINRGYYTRLYQSVSLTPPLATGQSVSTHTVAGLRTSDTVFVQKVDSGSPAVLNARVSAVDTLELNVLDPDGNSGLYNIYVIQVE